ncbi:hypothetical protein RHGRI_033290 [Rhododendron griersonianum]|uniref:Uncharacterized protein n=1 Tax=Rhododendron griersonianum TaxID=479676 RepID=A0AAV6HX19_9ERIC|nr:hypothetical protein RHGRI_033290 [Rhododendron griersonianum]
MQHIQAAVRVKRYIPREGFKELDHAFVAADGILDDPCGVQEANVLGRLDDFAHEEDIGGDLVPRLDMEPLESNEVQKRKLGSVVQHYGRETQHPGARKGDVVQARAPALLELDPGIAELHR